MNKAVKKARMMAAKFFVEKAIHAQSEAINLHRLNVLRMAFGGNRSETDHILAVRIGDLSKIYAKIADIFLEGIELKRRKPVGINAARRITP